MTEAEFDKLLDDGKLDDEYSVYLMNHSDARICNGNDLILAIESGRYYEGFKDYMVEVV